MLSLSSCVPLFLHSMDYNKNLRLHSLLLYSSSSSYSSYLPLVLSPSLLVFVHPCKVGSGEQASFSPRRVRLFNTRTEKYICELNFVSSVLNVKLNRSRYCRRCSFRRNRSHFLFCLLIIIICYERKGRQDRQQPVAVARADAQNRTRYDTKQLLQQLGQQLSQSDEREGREEGTAKRQRTDDERMGRDGAEEGRVLCCGSGQGRHEKETAQEGRGL